MTVFVIFSQRDTNYGQPFKVFSDKEKMEQFLRDNKDSWGLEYCWEEIEVE